MWLVIYGQSERVYEELERLLAEQSDLLSPKQQEILLKACRRHRARNHLAEALGEARARRKREAVSSVCKALGLDCGVLFSRGLYSVIARLSVPHMMQGFFLRAP